MRECLVFSIVVLITVLLCPQARANPGDLLFEFQKPNHAAYDRFGRTMASIGNNVLISAPFDDTAGSEAGAVFMYNGSGQLLQTFYNPTPYTGSAGVEYFGASLSCLGNSVLVGDPYDSSVVANGGAVYMFNSATGQLQQTFLNPSGLGSPGGTLEEIEHFGAKSALATSGADGVLVGAYSKKVNGTSLGGAYLFSAATGGLLHEFACPTPQEYSRFGYAVASAGGKIAIGQSGYSQNNINAQGAVHLYDGDTGAYLYTLYDPTPNTAGQFGLSLAAMDDKLLVGGGGGAYLFDVDTGTMLLEVSAEGTSQSWVAMVDDDLLVGARNYNSAQYTHVGRAYLFDGETGNLLLTIENPGPDSFEYFGESIAAVGHDIAVGADYDDTLGFHSGAAYLFEGFVPEPATVLILAGGGLGLLRRKSHGLRGTPTGGRMS
jgi:hypothetical protein